jgi:hypothetical protein
VRYKIDVSVPIPIKFPSEDNPTFSVDIPIKSFENFATNTVMPSSSPNSFIPSFDTDNPIPELAE